MAVNVMPKDDSNATDTNCSNKSTEMTNYSNTNVNPKKSDVEAQNTNKPTQNTTEKSFWKDHPKTGIFIGLFAILSIVGIGFATYVATQKNPPKFNCNESACKVGTGIGIGVKGAVAATSYAMCKYKFGFSCAVYPGL